MMSKGDVLRLGVQVRLREIETEKRALLRLIGEPVSKGQTGLEILAAAEGSDTKHKAKAKGKGSGQRYTEENPHWTQTPKGRAMQRRRMKARQAEASGQRQ